MKKTLRIFSILLLSFLSISLWSQGQGRQWRFGYGAGLDFNTSPPSIVLTNAMTSYYSSASIADASGNLLFYTDGTTVWDHTNNIMANGSGLNGNGSSYGSQTAIILPKPGSTTNYYIFNTDWNYTASAGLYYSEVDMSLSAGNGSVITQNVPVFTVAATTSSSSNIPGKLTATRHCNGTDIWLVSRDWYYNYGAQTNTLTINNSFRSFLISSTGVNTTAVVSTPATYTYNNNWGWGGDWGCMKISPNGKKLGLALYDWGNVGTTATSNGFELYDYDNTTGVVSNSLALISITTNSVYYSYSWGCEFSPDGTKLYGSRYSGYNNTGGLYQWDLCAGSPTAIAASIYTVTSNGTNYVYYGALQMAPDGKVYMANDNFQTQTLDVINSPNLAGSACNYIAGGQSIAPNNSYLGLPNFMNSYFLQHPTLTPFTNTVSLLYGCQTASFNSVYTPSTTTIGCAATGYSLNSLQWNFGDPLSGANNTSTLTNPSHAYSSLGTYTAQLILYYSCGGGSDTLRSVVNVNVPCISVQAYSISCASLGSATVTALGGVGPFSYTWMPTSQTNSVATNLQPGTYVVTVYDQGNGFTYTASTVFNSLIPLSGSLQQSGPLPCNGVPTGSAAITNLAGGSGSQSYLWTNGVYTYATPSPTNLYGGTWSVTVTDNLTACTINKVFFLSQPPALTITLGANTPTACTGSSITLHGTTSGGTSGYSYTWTTGPTPNDTLITTQVTGGPYVYTLTSTDGHTCLATNTISVNFVDHPVLIVPTVSICPLQTGTLTASGATNYTWTYPGSPGSGSTYTASPASNTQYTLTGEALGCTSIVTTSIIIKPVPNPILNSNSPVCNGQSLQLFGSGGTGYNWTGPQGYTSFVQGPVINPAVPANSGVYQVTVTAANSCTASSSISVTVNPTPTVSVSGSTVCVTQTLMLTATSFTGALYHWTGPNAFVSSQQNPTLAMPSVAATGNYSVTVTSTEGCTNTGIANASIVALPVVVYSSNSPRCFGSSLIFNASATSGGISYFWSGPNGFLSGIQNPTLSAVTSSASGIYTLQVTTGPCVVSHTAAPVIINPLPNLTITCNPACEGKPLDLMASGTATGYTWVGPNSFIYHKPDTTFNPVSFSMAGNYTVVAVDINGCVSSSIAVLSVLANPAVSASGATVCLNNTSTLTAQGAFSYLWIGPFSYYSYLNPATVPITSPWAVGDYTVVGTAANGCTNVATANVTIQPLPRPSLIVTNTACVGSLIDLQGFGGFSYAWAGPANFRNATSHVSFPAFSHAQSGTYTLTVTDSIGCKKDTTTGIVVQDLPSGSLLSDAISHCVPFCSNFRLLPNAASSIVSTTWQLDGKNFNTDTFNYCFTKPGDYLVKGTFTDLSCTGNSTFLVNAYEVPLAGFSSSPEKPVENNDHVLFTSTTTGQDLKNFSWTIGDAASTYTTNSETASYFFNTAGTYPVVLTVSNTHHCSDTIIRMLSIAPDFNVFVPNAFTPNSDGKNEVFMPVTRNVSVYNFVVVDRWGTVIFSTDNPASGWDGTYKGEICKQDVYFWKATVSSKNGDQKKLTGEVTLLR